MLINNYIDTAKGKINNKPLKTFVLAIYAGMFIAIAGILSTVVALSITNYSVGKILSALVFPMGLILVILMKTELFTGNSLLVIPLLNKDIKLKELLKNWLIVYLGNLCGALIISVLIINTPLKSVILEKMVAIGNTKINLDFIQAIILGLLCNFMVCLAVFLATNANTITEKIAVIFIPILIFVALSFEHSVANMSYLSLAYLLDNGITLGKILLNNLLPVTIGNILGGTILGCSIWYLRKE